MVLKTRFKHWNRFLHLNMNANLFRLYKRVFVRASVGQQICVWNPSLLCLHLLVPEQLWLSVKTLQLISESFWMSVINRVPCFCISLESQILFYFRKCYLSTNSKALGTHVQEQLPSFLALWGFKISTVRWMSDSEGKEKWRAKIPDLCKGWY